MNAGYSTRAASQRLTRRRAIGAAGAIVGGSLLIAACGSDSDKNATGDKSRLLAKPEDTTKQAKRGGTLKRSQPTDVSGLEPYQSGMTNVGFFEMLYSRPFSLKPGLLEPSQDEIAPDLCDSWEWSPDRLTLTAKLRQNAKFHNVAPANGRVVDIDDVLYSWKRFATTGSNRTIVANSANPQAPVLSVEAADTKTLVIKFKEPLVYAQAMLTSRAYWNVVPKEAENLSVLDLRKVVLGTGPFMLSDYQPSVGMTFKRHAAYWDKDRPFIDQLEYPIVPEYATAIAQFRVGGIHTYAVRQEDILTTKREIPQLSLYQTDVVPVNTNMFYGWQQATVRDKRVRQAFSMSIARDDWIDAQYNTKAFESQGLPVEKRWNSSLQALDSLKGWWLDPKSKDFGPNAKFFDHDVAEAKKLLSAAGYTTEGPEITSNSFTSAQFGPDFPKLAELWETMASESGIRIKKNIVDYTGAYLAFRDTNGKFGGISYKNGPPAPTNDPTDRLSFEFTQSGGVGYHGFDLAGKGDFSGDPYLETELRKARLEVDTEKRRTIVHEVQRYLGQQMYSLRWPGGATAYELIWPAVRNFRVYLPSSQLPTLVSNTNWWLDDTQAPLKKT